ncbi:MAG: thiol:disulfide interchange protein [Crocinitomicaceae bacterium]|jgi:thiol:disulfide interchange protein
MKKIIGLIGVVAIAVFAMSSTCSKEGITASDANSKKAVSNETSVAVASVPDGAGITFKSMTLEKAQKEALKSGKLIFIDAYTDWCGPCKRMAATSFKDPAVGELFNANFINLKIEMEKNPEGPGIARKYSVKAYPTLIIIDGTGKVVKQTIGMKSKDQLLAMANSVL